MNSDLTWLILSTVFLFVGIAITYWVHNQQFIEIHIPESEPPEPSTAPLISVIVPARNEARNIRSCIEALVAQTYPILEFILVDDRSTDNTLEIVEDFSAHLNYEDGPAVKIISGVSFLG